MEGKNFEYEVAEVFSYCEEKGEVSTIRVQVSDFSFDLSRARVEEKKEEILSLVNRLFVDGKTYYSLHDLLYYRPITLSQLSRLIALGIAIEELHVFIGEDNLLQVASKGLLKSIDELKEVLKQQKKIEKTSRKEALVKRIIAAKVQWWSAWLIGIATIVAALALFNWTFYRDLELHPLYDFVALVVLAVVFSLLMYYAFAFRSKSTKWRPSERDARKFLRKEAQQMLTGRDSLEKISTDLRANIALLENWNE